MANIKIGGWEGDAQDIEGIFQRNGLRFEDYLAPPKEKKTEIHYTWAIGSIILFFIISCCVWTNQLEGKLRDVEILLLIFSFAALLVIFHMKFSNFIVTGICIAFGVVVILISLGVMSPEEGVKKIQETLPKLKGGE